MVLIPKGMRAMSYPNLISANKNTMQVETILEHGRVQPVYGNQKKDPPQKNIIF